ncbi:hypothetical protein Baya_10405 [Bagarius yarrelli]|uniref:Uncharacterized protein n=1 Tax=Bagarius yarrelli TaxID=175774 RepID=A0A556UF56_BAGYA|nr:hypothetical protein Baya_10405 [Bagarius yarrelli]
MLGWVRALRQSACMDTDDIINRRCSSCQDFSQIGGSTESVNPLHAYRNQNKLCHTAGKADTENHRGRHSTTHSYDTQTRSLSLDRTGVDHFRYHGSGPSTPRSHYESRSHSPVDLRPQSLCTDEVRIHGNMWMTDTDVPETPTSLSDIKPSPTNQISTLTINNMVSEETNQNVNSSTNQRAEWFLSTSHWQDFIPLNIQEEELLSTNQNSDTAVNQERNQTTCVAMETFNQNSPSDAVLHQPIETSPDSHMTLNSEHSERKLCIYEEIPCKASKSAKEEEDGSAVGGVKGHHLNLSTSQNVTASSDFGENGENTATTEETEEETGSDIIRGKTAQNLYNCLSNNSGTSDSLHTPRVTVINTSL